MNDHDKLVKNGFVFQNSTVPCFYNPIGISAFPQGFGKWDVIDGVGTHFSDLTINDVMEGFRRLSREGTFDPI
jgi:hypothetical protein